jgi:hypothetical protein
MKSTSGRQWCPCIPPDSSDPQWSATGKSELISAYADASQIRPRHHRQCTLNIPDGVVGRRGSTGCDRVNSAGRAVGIGCRAQCHLRRQCVGVLVIDKAIVREYAAKCVPPQPHTGNQQKRNWARRPKPVGWMQDIAKIRLDFFAMLLCSATSSLAPVARQHDDEPTIKFHGKEYRLLCPEVQTSLPELWSLHPYSITLQACKE